MASRISRSQVRALMNLYRRPYAASGITSSSSSPSLPLRLNGDCTKVSFNSAWQSATCCGGARAIHTSQPLDDTHQLKMPSLSPTMTEGTIVKWMKKEGDAIAPGDVLCEIQTDKAVVSMDLDEEGILAKILVAENTPDIKVGALIALMVDEGDDWKNVEIPADAGAAPSAGASAPPSAPAAAASSSSSPPTPSKPSDSHGGDRLIGPAVKNYLRQYGLDASKVLASGPHGTVTKGDVLKHVQANKMEPVSHDSSASASSSAGKAKRPTKAKGKAGPATFKDLEITNMRKTIAKRLLQSKQTIPHAYGIVQCDVKSMVSFRKSLAAAGIKVSVNDLIIKSVANALSMNPAINCVWEGSQLKRQNNVDISVAVATPNGLITPIVPDVVGKDVVSISTIVKNLAAKARDGKLQPHEFMGGSFSISNLGMFGIHSFSAIINPPQCAILAVGGTTVELDEDGDSLSTSKMMLSYDASAIMEDEAMKFLAVLKNEIENMNEVSMGIFSVQARGESLAVASAQ